MIALRYVMEALKKPPNNKMYLFGVAALNRYRVRLQHMEQYCEYLMQSPNYESFPQHLKEYIEHGVRSQEPPAARSGGGMASPLPVAQPPPPAAQPSLATTTVTTATATTTTTTTSSTASHGAIERPHRPAVTKVRPHYWCVVIISTCALVWQSTLCILSDVCSHFT